MLTLPPGMISWLEGRMEKRGGTRRTGKKEESRGVERRRGGGVLGVGVRRGAAERLGGEVRRGRRSWGRENQRDRKKERERERRKGRKRARWRLSEESEGKREIKKKGEER